MTAVSAGCEHCTVQVDDGVYPLPASHDQRGGDTALVGDELLHIIRQHINIHPRSQQQMPGPSELGTPCTRRLAYRLLNVPPTNNDPDKWKPTIGTAVHTWLEQALLAYNNQFTVERFYVEQKVDVGELHGRPVKGTCDVYDRFTATTIDWKVVGLAALKRYRKDGPGQQYRVQAHLYGRGFVRAGLPVDHVGVLFLPQNDDLSSAFFWHEPYDEQIALDALTRANGVADLVEQLHHKALPLLPTADAFCTYCPWNLPAATDVTEACAGHLPPIPTGVLPVVPAAPAA